MTAVRAVPAARALVGYAVLITVGGRRWLLYLGVLVAASIGFGLLSYALDEPTDEAFGLIVGGGFVTLLLPLACLVVGDGVLGAEVRSGTFQLTWLSPVPVWLIVVSRWLAGAMVAAVTLGGGVALSALVAGSPSNLVPAVVAIVLAAVAYVAVFVFFGATFRRAALWGIAFVFLFEQLLGAALSGIAQYSPQWLARGVLADLGTMTNDLARAGVPEGGEAVIRLILVTLVALGLATWRLRRLTLSGGRD